MAQVGKVERFTAGFSLSLERSPFKVFDRLRRLEEFSKGLSSSPKEASPVESSKPAIKEYDYPITSFLINEKNDLSLSGLIALIGEVAWIHVADLGFGYEYLEQRGRSWILLKQRVQMQAWPRWGETLTLRTWLRPNAKVVVEREFEFLLNSQVIGRASSFYISMNLKTRKPEILPFPSDQALFFAKPDPCPDPQPIRLPFEPQNLSLFKARPSECDMHQHVNNAKIAAWIADTIPGIISKNHSLREYQVEFLSEVKLGDTVDVLGKSWSTQSFTDPIALEGKNRRTDQRAFLAQLQYA